MRWPWQHNAGGKGRLIIGSHGDALAWLVGDAQGRLERGGLLRVPSPDALAPQVRSLGLPTRDVTAVLGLTETQLLQVEAPTVKPDEMKAAARWRVKDLVEGHVDDLTIDVISVGDGSAQTKRELFVAAAKNELIRELAAHGESLGLTLSVIDIAEMSQRNLQHAAAERAGLGARATASLLRHGRKCLLTICAGGELYDCRRLDWDAASLLAGHGPESVPAAAEPSMEGLDFIDYGAMDSGAAQAVEADAPRLIVEVQRSFDVWERSWPNLPLAALWVHAGDDTDTLVDALSQALHMKVSALDPDELVPGFADAAPTPEARDALLPLLGALRRGAERSL